MNIYKTVFTIISPFIFFFISDFFINSDLFWFVKETKGVVIGIFALQLQITFMMLLFKVKH